MRVSASLAAVLACALAAGFTLSGCQKAPPAGPVTNDAFEAGRAAAQKSDYKTALAAFNTAATNGLPVDARLFYDRGVAEYNLAKYKEAISDFTEALRRYDANHAELGTAFAHYAYGYRGVSNVYAGKYLPAKRDLIVAVGYSPRSWIEWNCLGYARFMLGDNKGAIVDFDRGMPLTKNDWNDHFTRANALYAVGNYRRAIIDYTLVIEHDPQHRAGAYQNRGQSYKFRGDYKLADKDFTQAIKLIPKAWSWAYRCETREFLNREADALYDCNHAIADYPRWAFPYISRAYAKMSLGAEKGALADADSAIKLEPKVAMYYDYRGIIRRRMSQYRGAFMDYARAIRLEPGYAKPRIDRRDLGNWILSAQHAGFTGFGIGSLNVEQLENENAPSESEYSRAASACGGYFSAGDSYFDDCIQKGVEGAKNDELADEDAEQQAEHDNYEVAQQVQEQENYQQQQVEEAAAAQQQAEQEAGASYNSGGGGESEGGGYSEQPEQSEEQAEPEQQSEPEPVEAAPAESGGE